VNASTRDSGEAILSAAAELFAEGGYKATTTRAIARRAGVNEVTIFRRFTNKQGVLRALGEEWARGMAGFAVDRYPAAGDTRDTLAALARMEVEQATQIGGAAMRLAFDARSNPEVAALMGSGPSDNHEGLAQYVALRQAAGDLRDNLSPDVVAEAFFALTSTLVMSRQLLSGDGDMYGLTMGETADQLFELFWSGIEKREC